MQNIIKVITDLHKMHRIPLGTETKVWPDEMKKQFLGALTFFMREPGSNWQEAFRVAQKVQTEKRAWLQAKGATTLDMTPSGAVIDPLEMEKYKTGLDDVDLGYEQLFALVDMRGSSLPSFNINDVAGGVTWAQYETGEGPKVESPGDRSNALTVKYMNMGAALGFYDDWFRFQQYWDIADAAEDFRASYYSEKAKLFYRLIATNVTAQAFDTNVVTTINNACASILRALLRQGYKIGSNPGFDILCPPEMLQVIGVALDTAANIMMRVDQKGKLTFNIRNIISTVNYCDSAGNAVTDKFDVVLPGKKMKRGEWKDMTTESKRDIFVRATEIVGHSQYNCGKGNTHQVRRCATQ